MTRAQALKLARAKFGAEAFVDQDRRTHFNGLPLPKSDADRAVYRAEFLALKESEPKWDGIDAWDGDTPLRVYRDALAKYTADKRTWRERKDAVQGLAHFHAFKVGTRHSIFTESKGYGDSWEDALRAAKVAFDA